MPCERWYRNSSPIEGRCKTKSRVLSGSVKAEERQLVRDARRNRCRCMQGQRTKICGVSKLKLLTLKGRKRWLSAWQSQSYLWAELQSEVRKPPSSAPITSGKSAPMCSKNAPARCDDPMSLILAVWTRSFWKVFERNDDGFWKRRKTGIEDLESQRRAEGIKNCVNVPVFLRHDALWLRRCTGYGGGSRHFARLWGVNSGGQSFEHDSMLSKTTSLFLCTHMLYCTVQVYRV